MVFRYSIVPETYTAPNMIGAPAMPSNDAHAEFQKDTGAADGNSAGGLQSSAFQSAPQPASSNTTQPSDQGTDSSSQPTPQQPQQQKKKSKWKIPTVSEVPIPH
jgi:hypothetical protein